VSILLLGLNHRSAPVEVRERLAFSRQGVATALMLFRRQFPDCEAAILSTCNRVEFLFSDGSEDGVPAEVEQRLVQFLAQVRSVPAAVFERHLYRVGGADAVRHVFRVISGLDSMVLGECQIVNQLRQAYELAHEQQTAGPVLHRLFHHAFGVSKRVRTEARIGDGKTSIPSLAADVIREGAADFRHARILVVGAGEMARLSLEHLSGAGARNFVVTTRTVTNARPLADAYHGRVAPFEALDEELASADIVITATNCPMPIITAERLRRTWQAHSARGVGGSLLLIDLCVPRNVEPEVARMPGVTLYDVDALGRAAAETERGRRRQVKLCEQIVEEEGEAFGQWLAETKVRPLIEQMFEDVRALAAIEVRGFFRRCPELTDVQRDAVTQLADRLVAKLMHPCVATVRKDVSFDSAAALADAFHDTRLSFAARVEASAGNAASSNQMTPAQAPVTCVAQPIEVPV
jgi:glutamyl-tRNA reductase